MRMFSPTVRIIPMTYRSDISFAALPALSSGDGDMTFQIYGRRSLEVRRENNAWEVYCQDQDVGLIEPFMSSVLETEDSATYLDDIYYELAGPGYDSKLLS